MSYEQDIRRGQLAETVLGNEVYCAAYKLLAESLIAKWRESDDPAQREELHKLLKLLDKVQNLMEGTMRSGKVAASELERRRSLAERVGLKRVAG